MFPVRRQCSQFGLLPCLATVSTSAIAVVPRSNEGVAGGVILLGCLGCAPRLGAAVLPLRLMGPLDESRGRPRSGDDSSRRPFDCSGRRREDGWRGPRLRVRATAANVGRRARLSVVSDRSSRAGWHRWREWVGLAWYNLAATMAPMAESAVAREGAYLFLPPATPPFPRREKQRQALLLHSLTTAVTAGRSPRAAW